MASSYSERVGEPNRLSNVDYAIVVRGPNHLELCLRVCVLPLGKATGVEGHTWACECRFFLVVKCSSRILSLRPPPRCWLQHRQTTWTKQTNKTEDENTNTPAGLAGRQWRTHTHTHQTLQAAGEGRASRGAHPCLSTTPCLHAPWVAPSDDRSTTRFNKARGD